MTDLAGLQVLVVEDEGVVALLIEDMLEELGCTVAASVSSLSAAIEAAGTLTFDVALLDVNLNGQQVFPVAELLQGRQMPLLFSTGYGRVGVPERFQDYEVLLKPFDKAQLEQKLRATIDRR